MQDTHSVCQSPEDGGGDYTNCDKIYFFDGKEVVEIHSEMVEVYGKYQCGKMV